MHRKLHHVAATLVLLATSQISFTRAAELGLEELELERTNALYQKHRDAGIIYSPASRRNRIREHSTFASLRLFSEKEESISTLGLNFPPHGTRATTTHAGGSDDIDNDNCRVISTSLTFCVPARF